MRPVEAFLSHAEADRPFAERLARALADHGIPVWQARRDVRGARQWHDEIGAALGRCDWFLLVLSPAAVTSRWVKRELLYTLDEPRYDGRILPLRHLHCDVRALSWTLPALQQIDFAGSFDAGCTEVLRTWEVAFRGEPGRTRDV